MERKVIVVGASSGIGEALARRLVAEGCRVALVARRGDVLAEICGALNAGADEVRALAYVHDVRDCDAAGELFERIVGDLQGLDVVVYAAGAMPSVAEDEYDFRKDRQMLEVNTLGALSWLNLAAGRFEKQRAGCIVAISSISGDRGRRKNPAYAASKAAVNTFMEALRNRLSRYGVRVVTVKPGYVDTPMTRGKEVFWMISAEEAAAAIWKAIRGGSQTVYVPRRWGAVGFVIRHIPSFIFRRMSI